MAQRLLITAGSARVHIADVNADAVQQITSRNPAISGSVGDV